MMCNQAWYITFNVKSNHLRLNTSNTYRLLQKFGHVNRDIHASTRINLTSDNIKPTE